MKRTMMIVVNAWRLCFFCIVGGICGCGNSEVESKIYERYHGEIPCWSCKMIKIGPDYPDYVKTAMLQAGVKAEDVYPKYVNVRHPISGVSSRKSDMDDIWIVTVKAKCPTVGKDIERIEEYSYRHGKISLVKKVSPWW